MTEEVQQPGKPGWSRRSKLLIGGGVAVAIALGGAAGIAQAKRGHWGGHHGGMMPNMVERYDANKDGKVSQEEIDGNRTAWYGEFDADKSGGLAIEEFSNLWLKARREQMVREFQEFDRDGDGKLTLDEYKGPMAGTVAEMDRNGDGVLSKDDRMKRHGRRHGGGMMERDGDAAPPPPPPAQ